MRLKDWIRARFSARRGDFGLEAALELHESGQIEVAEERYREVLKRDPRNARALHLLGVAAHQRGDNAEARKLIGRAIEIERGEALFRFNLGNVLAALGEPESAAGSFREALKLEADYPGAWFNLAKALSESGDSAGSIHALLGALRSDPSLPGAWETLAAQVIAQGEEQLRNRSTPRDALALDALRANWGRTANPIDSRFMLAFLLQQRAHWSEAAGHYEAVLAERPELWTARNNLANCLNQLGRMDEAVAQYRATLALNPDLADAATGICSGVNYDPQFTPERVFREHADWAKTFASRHYPAVQVWPNDRNPARRLRIGYLSPDFNRHPVSNIFAPILERHDRGGFEVFCYYNFDRNDTMTARLRGHADGWRVVTGMSDDELAAAIAADGIDILVDLAGHTSRHRLQVLARRPAPVQASWLGYFTTTGLATVDYFITDPHSSPPGQDAWFTERLVRLPRTRFCYEPWEGMPEANALPAQSRGKVTFGSFNNLAKLNREVLLLWARVLDAVPGSRLMLQAHALGDEANRERFTRIAAAAGLPPERVELRPFEFMQAGKSGYHDIDIALDPFPFCGGLTSFDSLWMGVPVVTLPQQLIAGRQTASMLANLGLGELSALDRDHYVGIAAGLAADPSRLAQLRATLRSRFLASPLADYSGFARDLERAYRAMWRSWVAGTPKAPITL